MIAWLHVKQIKKKFYQESRAGRWISGASIRTNLQIRLVLALLGVAVVYAGAAIGGLLHAVVGNTVTLVWAPSGIALAALFIFGFPMAAGVALGAFLANAWTGVSLWVAAGIAAGNTLEAVAGVLLLTRFADFASGLHRRRDVFAFIGLAAVASTMLSASIGVFTLLLGGLVTMADATGVWVKWWLGDMMGVLVVAPALLVWLDQKTPGIEIVSRFKAFEAALLGATLVWVSYLIFGAPELAGRSYYPSALAVFPFVIWGALRFGQRGASLLTLVVALLAVWGTAQGRGPFMVDSPVDSLVRWCTFAIVVAVTGLLLAASVAEQQRAQTALKLSHSELDRLVRERTSDLQNANTQLRREMIERRHLESELIRISEVQNQTMGRELHDGLGQYLTSLSLMGAALQQKLHESQSPEVEIAARMVRLASDASDISRTFAQSLCPVAFEFGGLSSALERLAERTCMPGGIQCNFQCDTGLSIADDITAINFYRIAQEAVNNALKYSEAGLILIELRQIGDQYRLCVSDDGVGFDVNNPVHQHGVGMHSMHYRARLLGGTFLIEPQLFKGTRIVAAVPAV
ncbi:MAG: MASE1 domain-containing protein [Polaromonas sp.]|nr:MASE1 domain-containing protein [Polaromonas sp.]